jgi:GTPase SAR1 family protein
MSKKIIENMGFCGSIGNTRRLFYLVLSKFDNGKPTREEVFNELKQKLNNLSGIAVSYGDCRRAPDDTVEIFLEFSESTSPLNVAKEFDTLNRKYACKREFVRADNARTKLIHVTREDIHTVYEGCDSADFSLNFKMLTEFSIIFKNNSDLDVVSLSNKYNKSANKIRESYREFFMQHTVKIEHYLILNKYFGWQKKVVDWYNQFIATAGSDTQIKQLYLYGNSGCGKSSFINHLFGKRFDSQIFRPITGQDSKKYQWESFSSKIHSLVLFDEFDFSQIDLDKWKKACEGIKFQQLVRNSSEGNLVEVNCPIIMISNYEPLENVRQTSEHHPILKRIVVIQVDEIDERGKQRVDFVANLTEEEVVGLSENEIKQLPNSTVTTLTLARIRNERTTSEATGAEHNSERPMTSTQLSSIDLSSSREQRQRNVSETDSALSLTCVSETHNMLSLDESIEVANNLSVEQLEEILMKKRKSNEA